MTKSSTAINGRLSPLLRAIANELNARGVPDAEILRRGIRRVAEEEGIAIEEIQNELLKRAVVQVTA